MMQLNFSLVFNMNREPAEPRPFKSHLLHCEVFQIESLEGMTMQHNTLTLLLIITSILFHNLSPKSCKWWTLDIYGYFFIF